MTRLPFAFAAAFLALAQPAAALTWNWAADGGAEAGTFITDGDALAGASGVYTLTGFTYDQSGYLGPTQVTSWELNRQGAATMT